MNLKELSENLGLSQTTVSRALNGYPEVSETTRKRVRAAAEQFNYVPSNQAKALATGRAWSIGHVIPVSKKHEMVNPIFGDFIAGAGEVYGHNGYEMILSVVDSSNNEATVYRELKSRKAVDGVVVHGPTMNDPRIELLREINLPFVVHGRASGVQEPYSWLDINNRRAFKRATDFLLDLGHRRIALINGLEGMDFAHRRRVGFEQAMAERGADVNLDYLFSDEMTETQGYVTTRKLLAMDTPPTAILVSSLISAIGVRRALWDTGKVMGRDISVITHDDALSYLSNAGDVPIFTATRSSMRQAGNRVAEMILAQIADPSIGPQTEMLETELIIGDSTGPVPSS